MKRLRSRHALMVTSVLVLVAVLVLVSITGSSLLRATSVAASAGPEVCQTD